MSFLGKSTFFERFMAYRRVIEQCLAEMYIIVFLMGLEGFYKATVNGRDSTGLCYVISDIFDLSYFLGCNWCSNYCVLRDTLAHHSITSCLNKSTSPCFGIQYPNQLTHLSI